MVLPSHAIHMQVGHVSKFFRLANIVSDVHKFWFVCFLSYHSSEIDGRHSLHVFKGFLRNHNKDKAQPRFITIPGKRWAHLLNGVV